MRSVHLNFLEGFVDGFLRQATALYTIPSEDRLAVAEDNYCWDYADPEPFPQRIIIVTNVNFSPSDSLVV